MNDKDQEQFYDDDVEITDIPEEDFAHLRPGWLRLRSEASLRYLRHLPPRRRNLYLAATLGIIALVIIVIIGSSPATRDSLQTAIFGQAPTPTPTLAPGIDLFYIEGIPSWSQVSIDNHPVAHLPAIGETPIRIPRGQHVIIWDAYPFNEQSCTISVPPVFATDTCRVNQAVHLDSGLSAWVISFDVSLAMLPDKQQTALIQATQAALDRLQSTTIIWPGEQYAMNVLTGGDLQEMVTGVTATQPLQATLSFHLDAGPNSQQTCATQVILQDCQSCRLFCPAPLSTSTVATGAGQWNALALIYSSWTYTTLDGRVIAKGQSNSADHLLELNITWGGGNAHVGVVFSNQVTSQGDLACLSAEEEIGSTGEYSVTDDETGMNWHFSAASNPATGCLAIGAPLNNTATPASSNAYLLDRFGVILAANFAAHQYWRQLPVADTYELELAQQLAKKLEG
ncbi:MAG TPA: hypothetical protein VKV20_05715 [Ktedonobacteraceae bacterium]|jgi:hypothetical protein|nr:hypothetical protein [Ktedonobacteraceae bacterium]